MDAKMSVAKEEKENDPQQSHFTSQFHQGHPRLGDIVADEAGIIEEELAGFYGDEAVSAEDEAMGQAVSAEDEAMGVEFPEGMVVPMDLEFPGSNEFANPLVEPPIEQPPMNQQTDFTSQFHQGHPLLGDIVADEAASIEDEYLEFSRGEEAMCAEYLDDYEFANVLAEDEMKPQPNLSRTYMMTVRVGGEVETSRESVWEMVTNSPIHGPKVKYGAVYQEGDGSGFGCHYHCIYYLKQPATWAKQKKHIAALPGILHVDFRCEQPYVMQWAYLHRPSVRKTIDAEPMFSENHPTSEEMETSYSHELKRQLTTANKSLASHGLKAGASKFRESDIYEFLKKEGVKSVEEFKRVAAKTQHRAVLDWYLRTSMVEAKIEKCLEMCFIAKELEQGVTDLLMMGISVKSTL